jgi:hypothetical protein
MSTPIQTFADKTADTAPVRKKKQTPYRPVLSTIIRDAMEASVRDAIEAQEVMEEILEWSREERRLRDELRAEIGTFAPLDHRMQTLLQREVETLLRIGKLENRIAKLALTVTAMERRLATALVNSRRAVAPPRERAPSRAAPAAGQAGDGKEDA